MKTIWKTKACWCLLFGLACLVGGYAEAAEEGPDDTLIQMIVELVGGEDRDMRALGLQQIREEVPGEAATKQFAALLPNLPPDAQGELLDALGDRGDPAARPAVLEMLRSERAAVRAAALRALGALGSASDVPLLAGKAAPSDLEIDAARQSLVRLRGDDVNAAILAAMGEGGPKVRAVLLGVLAARNAKDNLPVVLQSAEDADAAVRLAALGALRVLADESLTATIVGLLKGARDDAERRQAELVLLVVCSRGGQVCAEEIIAGLSDAGAPSRIALLHALARAGGPKALEAVVARLKDEDEAVRDEAVRMLSAWTDPAVADHLLSIADTSKSLRHQVLALRGLVRLAGPKGDTPADLKILSEAMRLAPRPQEKRLVLGVLGGIGNPESLAMATSALDDPKLVEEAGLAAVMIAEKIKDAQKEKVRSAMEKVRRLVSDGQVRDRAQKVLKSL